MGEKLHVRLICLAILAAGLPFAAWNDFVEQTNRQFYDLLLSLRAPAGGRAPAVLLAVDDQTLARYGPLPFSRAALARGLGVLAGFEPRVVGIDLLLAEAGRTEEDAALAAGLARFPKLVLAAALSGDSPRAGWIWPLDHLAGRASIGHVHAAPDEDGVVRSVLLEKQGGGRRAWAFGLECARLYLGAGAPVEERASLLLSGLRIPARRDESRRLLVNYAGPEGVFRRVSFRSLLEGQADPADFRDRIVIVGVTAQGAGDRLFTPLSSGGLGMSGIEIHANVVRTVLEGAFLGPLGAPAEIPGYLAVAGAAVALAKRLRGLKLASALAALMLALPSASYAALRAGSVWPLASLLAVFVWAAGVALAAEYGIAAAALRREERRRQEYAFRVQAMAHEIKTPLTAIQGSSEMIADASVPEPARAEIAGLIHKESKRLTGLVETFLNVERISAGSLALEKQPVDLAALCAEVLERARLYAARKRTAIQAEVPPAAILADPELLSFAVYNLLTNAVKYSPKQSTVRLEVRAGAGGGVLISVTDSGQGIEPAEQKRIFERFYRGKQAAEPGTGLGLALVKEIAVQHGGRVEVDSKPGAGSRFTLVLPAGD
ncbi:MAG: CHASE2 domain-containing protein [Bryobacterales bacterium]|nr:CHASE2 domain-containing protein [Bryobacterales bacterium]